MSLMACALAATERLQLDLGGKTVLTEAATGPYAVTPVIAALAGATVYAYARTTRYGTSEEVFTETRELLRNLPRGADVRLVEEVTPDMVADADVITNSGHLRPLDGHMLRHARDTVVVPLMYEAWEWRDADVDLEYLKSRGIAIGATNERHPDVDVFGYLGEMAVKQIHDAGLTVYRNRFVLVCNNDFGPYIARTLSHLSDRVLVIDTDQHRDGYASLDIEWAGDFPNLRIPTSFRTSAAVILAAYPFDSTWFGPTGALSVTSLTTGLDEPFLLRYAGDVDTDLLTREGVGYFPPSVASGHMGVLPSAIGPEPIVRLQSAGLKVAELLMTGATMFNGVLLAEVI